MDISREEGKNEVLENCITHQKKKEKTMKKSVIVETWSPSLESV